MGNIPDMPMEPSVPATETATPEPVTTVVDGLEAAPTPKGPATFLIETPVPGPKEPKPEPVDVEDPELISESPAPRGVDDETEDSYAAHYQGMSDNAALEEMRAMTAGGEGEVKPAEELPAEESKINFTSAASDIVRGTMEAPSQILGGAKDATNAALAGLGEIGQWVTDKMPEMLQGGLVSDAEGTRILGKKEYKAWKEKNGQTKTSLQIPDSALTHEPTTVTGGLIRGMSQFLTGFAVGGKALGIGKGVVGAMAKGAVSDFAAFEGHEKNLANLLKDHTSLKGPVLDFLASDPSNSEAENRLKNALTGVLVGAGVEATTAAGKMLLEAMPKALKAMRDSRVGKAAQEFFAEPKTLEKELLPADLHPLGDPEKPLISELADAKFEQGKEMSKDLKPSDVRGKAGKAPGIEINFAKFETDEDISTVLKKLSQKWKKNLDEGRRGERSHAETKLSASEENAWKLTVERRKGQAYNAEETLAVRELWAQAGMKVKQLATLAANVPSEANLYNFRKMTSILYMIQKEVLGVRAEAGRALDAWKIPVSGNGKQSMKALQDILENAGGKEVSQEMASKIARLAQAGEDEAMIKMVQESTWAKTKDAVHQAFMSGLLSSPRTHVKNFSANLIFAAAQIHERAGAGRIGSLLGTQGGVELGEAAVMAAEYQGAIQDAFVLMSKRAKSLVEKDGLAAAGKDIVDFLKEPAHSATEAGAVKHEAKAGAFSSERWNLVQGSNFAKAMDFIEVATRTNGRLMGASDEMFKGLARRMEGRALAFRKATQELRSNVITKDQFETRMQDLFENPTHEMKKQIEEQAAKQTFTQKPNETLSKGADVIRKFPLVGRLLLPFKNTPINDFTSALERTPLAPVLQAVRQDIAAGGARADMALSRMATGTSIMWLASDLALSGKITGRGPQEPGQQNTWRRSHQQYSIRIGDKWVTYQPTGPFGQTLAMAADYAEAIKYGGTDIPQAEFEKAFVVASFSLMQSTLSKSYLQTFSDFMGAMTNSDQKAYGFAKRMFRSGAGTALTAVGGQAVMGDVTRAIDPHMRVADTMLDTLRTKIPGLSKTLPLARDFWGQTKDLSSGVGWGFDMVNPYYSSDAKQDPIDKEMDAIGLYPEMPNHKMNFRGIDLALNGKQYSRFLELAGQIILDPATGKNMQQSLNDLVEGKHPESPAYFAAKERDKMFGGGDRAKDYIDEKIRDFHRKARERLMYEDKALQVDFDVKSKGPAKLPAAQLFMGQ